MKTMHDMRKDPHHVNNPHHNPLAGNKKMREGSKAEEAAESPAFEAQEVAQGID